MRVSTGTIFDTGIAAIAQQQQSLLQTQQQIATGRRVATPADDPVASAQILQVGQAQSLNQQFATNQGTAKDLLAQTESTLGQVGSLLQDVRVIALNAGDPVLSNQDRASLATELQGKLEELLGLANSTDSNGSYMFSGYQGNTQPFSRTVAGVVYNGDEGQRQIQVAASRQLAVSDNGAEVFQWVKNGNGVFVTGAAAGNAGGGTIDGGQVIAPASLTGHNYQISFSVTGTTTTYTVTDTTTGNPVSAPAAGANGYTSGTAISFDGLQFTIQGQPANGDQFTVAPSTNQSVFTTLQKLITLLQSPVNGTTGQAGLTNGLSAALMNVDQALDKTLTVRTAVGTRQREVDALTSASSDADVQYSARLSELQDTDYAKAISDLTKQQMSLDAAQQSYAKITGKSLFDYL